jgi:hypothetical protein
LKKPAWKARRSTRWRTRERETEGKKKVRRGRKNDEKKITVSFSPTKSFLFFLSFLVSLSFSLSPLCPLTTSWSLPSRASLSSGEKRRECVLESRKRRDERRCFSRSSIFSISPQNLDPLSLSDPPTKELILSLNASRPQHQKFVIEDRLDDEHLLVDAKAAAEIRAFVKAKGEEVSFQAPPREAAA